MSRLSDLIGEADEYRWRRGGVRGAGSSGGAACARAGRGRGEAGAELHARAAAAPPASPRRDDRDASKRNANCSREPVHTITILYYLKLCLKF